MPDVPALLLDAPPASRQPLETPSPGRLAITAAPGLARLSLRGDAVALGIAFGIGLPDQPGGLVAAGDRTALWLGPDEWLLLGPLGALNAKTAVSAASVVDIGHRQVGLVLTGPEAADALSTGCPLDLHPTAFPPGRCTRTVFGKAEIVLWRTDALRFHVEVGRSFASYVQSRLHGAARELEAVRGL